MRGVELETSRRSHKHTGEGWCVRAPHVDGAVLLDTRGALFTRRGQYKENRETQEAKTSKGGLYIHPP